MKWLPLILLLLAGCASYNTPPDVTLTATPAPIGEIVDTNALRIGRVADGWQLQFPAWAGRFYQVEGSADLVQWRALSAPLPADRNPLATVLQGRFPMTATVLDPASRYAAYNFRVREVPNPYTAP